MNLWIVTIGSSDIQLDSDRANQEKERGQDKYSNKVWNYWYGDDLKADHYDISFEPKRVLKDKEEPYRIAARILGEVYQASSQEVQEEILSYLNFPLLDTFVEELSNHPSPDAIAILLTDQSMIFKDNQKRREKSPYWQDTCELKPILKAYFDSKFSEVPCEFITLIPESQEQSLDNWNAVLELVRREFQNLTIQGVPVKVELEERVYVSHQAGTPALSSAVQFVSLATFRESVQFLVSNEDTKKVVPIPQSTYLGAIRKQEARVLLDRHDYSGVRDILGLTGKKPTASADKRLRYLLDAGEQWNFAEFHKFKKILQNRNLLPQADFPWWRLGYESAYLAWVRLKQGSPLDAMFHSFRAVEGSATSWVKQKYGDHIKRDPDSSKKGSQTNSKKGLQISESICSQVEGMNFWFKSDKKNKEDENKTEKKVFAYGKVSFFILKETYRNRQNNEHIKIFFDSLNKSDDGNNIFDWRNNLFHQLEGLQKDELFNAWNTDEENWPKRVLGCLNFIAQEWTLEEFDSLEEASLMAKVHQELVEIISQL